MAATARGWASSTCPPAATVGQAAVEAVKPAADAKGVKLHVDLPSTPQRLVADPDRLQQVVWNLLSNAVKFTPAGGTVAVDSKQIAGNIDIRVTDTGQGIPPTFLPFVFDRFRQADSTSTRSHGGLGIGLTIVRHIVELHGGTVGAESAGEGQGATFIVTLPVTPRPAAVSGAASPSSDSKNNSSAAGKKVDLS